MSSSPNQSQFKDDNKNREEKLSKSMVSVSYEGRRGLAIASFILSILQVPFFSLLVIIGYHRFILRSESRVLKTALIIAIVAFILKFVCFCCVAYFIYNPISIGTYYAVMGAYVISYFIEITASSLFLVGVLCNCKSKTI